MLNEDKLSIGGGSLRAVAFACIAGLGPLVFGYTLGMTSPANLAMESSKSDSIFSASPTDGGKCDSPPCGLTSTDASEFGSLVNVGCMIGALLAGPLTDRLGRRGSILLASLPWFGAWLWIGATQSFAGLIVARIISGIATGVCSMAVPLFIAEVSPTSLRGALGAVNQFAVTTGIFLVCAPLPRRPPR